MKKYLDVGGKLAVVAAMAIGAFGMGSRAASAATFSQMHSTVSAVDLSAKTVTVEYSQTMPLYPSSIDFSNGLPTVRTSDILRYDAVLFIDGYDTVLPDITRIVVGHSIMVYLKTEGQTVIPYAAKDVSLVAPTAVVPGCDPASNTCSGTRVITSGGGVIGGTGNTNVQPPLPRPCTSIVPWGGSGDIVPLGPSTPCPSPTLSLDRNLGVGAQGSDVAALQQKLQALGYFSLALQPTGYFGLITKQAVMEFQQSRGISATGYVGVQTRAALGQ